MTFPQFLLQTINFRSQLVAKWSLMIERVYTVQLFGSANTLSFGKFCEVFGWRTLALLGKTELC